MVLDWTSRVSAGGGHAVCMNAGSSSLPHRIWKLTGQTLSSAGGEGLCLDWVASDGNGSDGGGSDGDGSDGNPLVEMRACGVGARL
jgi:hypothetical protein